MSKTAKKFACVALCLTMATAFAGCSSNTEMTEENVQKTVATVEKALQEFDTDTLSDYVDSSTLNVITKFAGSHKQFQDLGKAIFSNLKMSVDSVDLTNKTVTVSVTNKDLYFAASEFTSNLLDTHSKLELANLLSNDDFLDKNLSKLVTEIDNAALNESPIKVTLQISQGDKNLKLGFDEDAESAVSGGALSAIKSIAQF